MNCEQAKHRLQIHGYPYMIDIVEWSNGFLGQLKPYRGRIDDSVYEDIILCLKTLFEEVRSSNSIDTQIVWAVHNILHFGRSWVLDPHSGLRQSHRMPSEEVQRIETWLQNISGIWNYMTFTHFDKEYVFRETFEKIEP